MPGRNPLYIKKYKIWQTEWGSSMHFSIFKSNAHGITTLFRKGLDIEVKGSCKSNEG